MNNSAHMCLATDAMNVAPWAPFQSLWYVTTGQTLLPGVHGVPAEQRLTRTEALRHATDRVRLVHRPGGPRRLARAGLSRGPDRPQRRLLQGPRQRNQGHPVDPDDRRRAHRACGRRVLALRPVKPGETIRDPLGPGDCPHGPLTVQRSSLMMAQTPGLVEDHALPEVRYGKSRRGAVLRRVRDFVERQHRVP